MSKPPILTLTIKNRSRGPIVVKRPYSLDVEVQPFSGLPLKAFNNTPFISIDWDARTVIFDGGTDD